GTNVLALSGLVKQDRFPIFLGLERMVRFIHGHSSSVTFGRREWWAGPICEVSGERLKMDFSYRGTRVPAGHTFLLLLAGLSLSAGSAKATLVFTFTAESCTTGCNAINFGTVTVAQTATNT